ESRLLAEPRGSRELGMQVPPAPRQLLRSDAVRLGTARGQRGEIHRQGFRGRVPFPGVSPEAAEWLMKERKGVGLAVDSLSRDHGPSKDFKVHRAWLPSGRWGLENVANLDKVPALGATLVVGVAKVKDATGAPARLVALT